MIIVYITCKDEKEAKDIAKKLLEERLIGCANIIKEIDSIYWWKEKLEEQKEALLLCKTKRELGERVIERAKQLHSYEIPCIDVLEVKEGNEDYENWINEVVKE